MATASASRSDTIQNEIAGVTECSICTEVFTDPRSLPCVHTFCLKCLQLWGQDKMPDDTMECPLCRKAFPIPDGGLSGLPKNFFIEKMKLIRELSTSPEKFENCFCEACSPNEPDPTKVKIATRYCIECQEKLCEDCDRIHKTFKANRSHKSVEIGDQASCHNVHQLHTAFCSQHDGKTLELFCTKCKVVLCITCFVTSHTGHTCLDVNSMAEEVTVDIANMSEGIDQCDDILDGLSTERLEFVSLIENLENDVSKKAEQLKDAIEKLKQTVLSELKTVRQERLKQVDHLFEDIDQHRSLLTSLKQYAEELRHKGTASDIGREMMVLHNRTEELLKFDGIRQALTDLGTFVVAFTPSEVTLTADDEAARLIGRVESYAARTQSRPTLTHVIPSVDESEVFGVSASEDLLFVARYDDIEVYDTETFTSQQRIHVRGLGREGIRGLASCSTNGCLYVSDYGNKAVRKVELTPGNKSVKWPVDGVPFGLSLNDVRNVIVTCRRPEKILEYTTRGSLVRQLDLQAEVTVPWHAVQLSSDQFVVCHGAGNLTQHRVCAVDAGGQVATAYGNKPGPGLGQLNGPTHLAVADDGGLVFVADRENSRIVILKPSLAWSHDLELPFDIGLKGPRSICFDKSRGRLYVGEATGRRVLIIDNVL